MLLRQREEEEDEGDEEDGVRLVMKTTDFLSLTLSNLSLPRSLLFSVSFVHPPGLRPVVGVSSLQWAGLWRRGVSSQMQMGSKS